QVGWYTGWIEDEHGNINAFSLNMEMQKDMPLTLRKELVIASLKQLKVL
ncbi:MAG: class D beta-lactamase, partial [Acinetobacter sp.]